MFVCTVKNEDMSQIRVLESENSAVEWWTIEEVLKRDDVADWAKPVFTKIIQKLNRKKN